MCFKYKSDLGKVLPFKFLFIISGNIVAKGNFLPVYHTFFSTGRYQLLGKISAAYHTLTKTIEKPKLKLLTDNIEAYGASATACMSVVTDLPLIL